jgi:prephenate dehydrogenase
MPFERLSILGVGLLGGSIGLSIKSHSNNCKITGYGHNASTLDRARALGAIDDGSTNLEESVRDANLIILCTPVGTFGSILQKLAILARPGTLVTDVGSTKRTICRLADQTLPSGVHFVGSHPMAGSEKRGVESARADLYRGALCITTPTPKTDSESVRKVESFWQELGMRVTRLTPDDHDRLLADVSHLPHALAAALVMTQSDQALPLAGRGFADATRIAAGDAGLWSDIFLDNADNLRNSLRRLRQHLDRLESMLEPAQISQLRQWLDSAAQKRRARPDESPSGE